MLVSRFDPEREVERFDLRRATREATLERLGRVVAARERLDERERELVVAAREAGASWDEIGSALRISRSQAHRRHAVADPRLRRRRRPDPWESQEPPPEIATAIATLRTSERRRRKRARRRKRR